MNTLALRSGSLAMAALAATVVAAGCSSKTDTSPKLSFSSAAAVAGMDNHCGGKHVTVQWSVCHDVASADSGGAEGDAGDGGAGAGGGATTDYRPTMAGSEGDDDDCKYHVKWQSTALSENADVTFQVIATALADGSIVTGAAPYAEIYLNDTHPAPNTPVATSETSPGTYTIGPVRFDAAGNWNVRFHFNDQCNDSKTSPHGHAAFFVKVP